MRWLPSLLAPLLLAACQTSGPPPAAASPAPTATPAVSVRAPAQAILGDSDVGLPATGRNDALSASEFVASSPDQVVALEEVSGWGWSAAAHRSWAGGGQSVDDLVVLSDRDQGARRAYSYLWQRAAAAPLAAGGCPPAIAGLDDCALGTAGSRSVVVGRLGSAVFVLDVAGRDPLPLAAAQAARLRAG